MAVSRSRLNGDGSVQIAINLRVYVSSERRAHTAATSWQWPLRTCNGAMKKQRFRVSQVIGCVVEISQIDLVSTVVICRLRVTFCGPKESAYSWHRSQPHIRAAPAGTDNIAGYQLGRRFSGRSSQISCLVPVSYFSTTAPILLQEDLTEEGNQLTSSPTTQTWLQNTQRHMSLSASPSDQQLRERYTPPFRRKFKPKAKTGCHTCR